MCDVTSNCLDIWPESHPARAILSHAQQMRFMNENF